MTSHPYARATAAERDERMRQVLQLRLRSGLSVSEIARALDLQAKQVGGPDANGPSTRTVSRALARGYEAMRSDQPTLDDLKTELDGYLGELLRANLPKALENDVAAGKMMLEILDRQAALHGLNAPERIDLRSRVIKPDLADEASAWDAAPPVTEYDPDDNLEGG